jgi:hypothetical protein
MRLALILLSTTALIGAAAPDGVRLIEAEGEGARFWPQ